MPPSAVTGLVDRLVGSAGRPAVTWYGPQERLELSGYVLANWVHKASGLVTEELGEGPGPVLGIDLPAHWRAAVWALGAWQAGCTVAVPGAGPILDAVVTTEPGRWPRIPVVVALALPALARTAGPDLPPGVLDGNAELPGQSDRFAAPAVPAAATALVLGDRTVAFNGLPEWWQSAGTVAPGSRAAVRVGPATSPAALLATLLSVWDGGGSVVVLTDGAQLDTERTLRTENVTVDLGTVAGA